MTDYSQPLRPVEKYLILAARYFFGGHALISGANYFLKFLPDLAPRDPEIAVRFIHVMIDTHLYDLVKVMEVLTGLSLLSGVFMAPILVMEMPVTVVILYLSWFIAPTPRSIYRTAGATTEPVSVEHLLGLLQTPGMSLEFAAQANVA